MAVPPPADPHAKRALRAQLRAARDAFAPGAPPIVPPALFLARLHPGTVVATYSPVGGEPDPARFDAAARDAGAVLVLPRAESRAAALTFHLWDGGPLERGTLGMRQPATTAPERVPDIVLTPLVGFDGALARLGQGAGHYDRAFAALPHTLRIGLAWSVQRVETLPVDPWDVPLHAIVTEDAVLTGDVR